MCDREQPGKTDAIIFEAGVAINNVAMSKQSGLVSASSVEHAARLLADMPKEALESLLRGRKHGESSTNREAPETTPGTV